MILETVAGQRTAATATLATVTMIGGDALYVRSFRDPFKAWVIGMWGLNQTAGFWRLRSPRLHDNVDGLTVVASPAGTAPPQNVWNTYQRQEVRSQDLLNLELSGSATAGDIETVSVTLWYQNVDGSAARLIDEAFLDAHGKDIMVCYSSIVAGTAGGYSGTTALSAFTVGSGSWQANRDYALLGYYTDQDIASIGIRGIDSGSVRIGMPGTRFLRDYTTDFFIDWSRKSGLPTIPVFNAANKGGISVDLINNENALTVGVGLVFQLLDVVVAQQT